MDFIINRKVLGTDFHFLMKDGKGSRVYELPQDIIDVSSKKMWTISKLYKFDLPTFPPKKYKNSFYGLIDRDNFIPWADVIPKDVYVYEVKKYIQELKEKLSDIDLNYYEICYKNHLNLFNSLKPAKINTNYYWSVVKNNPMVRSFLPINGYSKKIEYNSFSSITGRLVVKNGPDILTVKKEIRNNIFESRFGKNGNIYSLDYSSLEPRILLTLIGKKNIPKDLYSTILKEVNIDIPRNAIKTTIISRLYGAQDKTITNQLKDIVSYPDNVIRLVDDYFEIDKAKEIVAQQFFKSDQSVLYNFYGRPIKFNNIEPHKLLNYFIQSTAVDVALFGFANIVNRIKMAEIEKEIVPMFVLHDALILDISKKYEYLIVKMLKVGQKNIPNFEDVIFHLEQEKIV